MCHQQTMSVLQTIGARQSTFTIDSTDATSTNFSELSIGKEKSASSTLSSDTNIFQDNHAFTKNARDESAKKRRLTSLNSRLSGSNKQQSYTGKQQSGTTDTNIHSDANPNTNIPAQLSSSVRNRLKQNHRRKVDISVQNQAEENKDEQVNGAVEHDELHNNERIIHPTVENATTTSSPWTEGVNTSKIRKIVSFNTHSEIVDDRSTVHFGDNRIANKTFLTKLTKDDSNLDTTPSSQTSYHRALKSKPAGDSQAADSQFHQSSTASHSVQDQALSLPDTLSGPHKTQIAGIPKALASQSYDRNRLAKPTREIHVKGNDSLSSDTDISNHYVEVQNEQRKSSYVSKSLQDVTSETASKKAGTNRVIHSSESHASSRVNNLGSLDTNNYNGNKEKTILIPVVGSAPPAANIDVRASLLFVSRNIGDSKQKVDRGLNSDSVSTKQPTTPFFPLDKECDKERVVLGNNEYCVNKGKKHDKQSKQKFDQKSVAESAENSQASIIQQAEVRHFKMARSGKCDYGNESFEDVLTERNDMAKTERVYRMRIRQLEEELKQMVHQCQVLSNENKELRKTLDGKKATKDRFDNVDVLTKLKKLESEKAKLAEEYNKTLKQMDTIMLEDAKIRSVNAELEEKVKELEKQVASFHVRLESNESEKTRGLEAKIRDLQATLEDVKSEKNSVDAKLKSLEHDNTSLIYTIESKRREIDEQTSTRTVMETNLKIVQDKNHHMKQEFTEMKAKWRDLEASKQTLQQLLNEQDNTFKKMKTESDGKDKIIAQLKRDSELNVQEIKKLHESQQASRDKEKESLVSRIASLKAEIDSSLSENYKLKQDREEMSKVNDKLRQENLEAVESCKESKKYFRKWEQEKEYRSKVETDLDKKKEEIFLLETRLKEAEKTVSILKNRVKSPVDEHDDLNNSTNNPEASNRVLKDSNMKLRQMLVERNIELTNTKHEQAKTESRIQHLELKQKRAEVSVRQLSEYIGSVIYSSGQENGSEATKIFPMSSEKKSPPSGPQKINSKQSPRKAIELYTTESTNIGGKVVEHTTSSLPLLETPPPPGPRSRDGYFSLYRDKQKRVQGKGYV